MIQKYLADILKKIHNTECVKMPKKKKYLSHVKITTVFPQTPPGDAGVEWEFSDVFMRLKIFVRSSTLKKIKIKN